MEASLEQVAKRAGLAIGTLYRHFPTRLHLVQAAFADKIEAWREAAEKAVAMDDAWEGLCLFLEAMCELQAGDRATTSCSCARSTVRLPALEKARPRRAAPGCPTASARSSSPAAKAAATYPPSAGWWSAS